MLAPLAHRLARALLEEPFEERRRAVAAKVGDCLDLLARVAQEAHGFVYAPRVDFLENRPPDGLMEARGR